jgi:hypothetical protein
VPGQNTPVKYLGPITITETSTVRAVALRDGWEDSPVAVSRIEISGASSLGACTYNPPPGVYGSPQSVTISNTDPLAQIYYTIDGTDPYRYFPLAKPYAGPVAINFSAPLKASAYRDGFGDSPRTVGLYTIGAIRMATENGEGTVYYSETVGPANQPLENPEIRNLAAKPDQNISVYPSPTDDALFINFGAEKEGMQISILNVLGQEVKRVHPEGASFGAAMSLKGQKAGVYIVRITDKSGFTTDKKIVLR